jgi:HPt (histidine-containing phosphotransfer) domain-containing protein
MRKGGARGFLTAVTNLGATLRRRLFGADDKAVVNVGPILVRVDAVAGPLLPMFMQSCRNDLAGMRAALGAGNFDGVCKTGHKLKGTGGSYGFDEITRIGAGIEAAAKSADRDRVQSLIVELESYLDRVKPVFD